MIQTKLYPYQICIAGVSIDCGFLFPKTADFFGNYILGKSSAVNLVTIPDVTWSYIKKIGGNISPYNEFTYFTSAISDVLLQENCAIIHAVAFVYQGMAWLLAGPSGIGKSTQIRTLSELYLNEFSVICGDRPVLQLKDDGMVLVHPSPWNGKEGWKGAESAPLAGILLLERKKETAISKLSLKDSVIPILQSLISSFGTADIIHHIASFETELLHRIPVWRYVNGGIPDSSRYLYEHLLCEVYKNEL